MAGYNLALLFDGTVRAWGYNGDGELGDGTYDSSNVPVQVSGLTDVIAIAAGAYHSLALLSDGTIRA
ncbi:RCC1 domain-containing protein [Neobacillus mesonae]|uniref:RCC1 domain-containing protein n=1 Tax=Neobacillus mesonae TaxID=1193713 RepID=UPI00203EBED0|nr:RCC1 domain-containing protein [Neobacillus mesonae]MCM3571360.1 RCC1 domain-containing protein [Neobacillus mesonae]